MEQQSNDRVAAALASLRLARKPFPLHALLTLYIKNESFVDTCGEAQFRYENSLYTNYFAGFKALVRWIGPIEIPTKQYPSVHNLLISYEVQEIAKILHCSPDIIWHTFLEVLNERYSNPRPEVTPTADAANVAG